MAVVQPEQTIGPGKDKVDELGQEEEWVRIPELYFEKTFSLLRLAKGGGVRCPLRLSIL
ncbi:MAG: hypothetical protein GY696_25705 [Gammaproteobacteria bacterium]|nr:hypothetical protein [Gammaproteobacteria bacterium]